MRSWFRSTMLRAVGFTFFVFFSQRAVSAPLVRDFPNGLHTAVVVDTRLPLVAIDVRFPIGEADDPLAWPGLARLVGILWEQAPTRHLAEGSAAKLFESAGVLWSKPNVGVNRDSTHVTFIVPAYATELALWMTAERLGFLADGVDALQVNAALATFKKQLDERAKQILGNVDDLVTRAAFGPDHPYGFASPGPSLLNVSPELVRSRLRSVYTAGDAYVTVVGNVPPGTEGLVEKYFSALPGTKLAPAATVKPARAAGELNIAADVRYREEDLVWTSAPYTSRDDVSLDVLAQWLRVRLDERLVQRERLAVSVFARQHSLRSQSLFSIRLTLADGIPAEKAIRAVEEELEAVRAGRIDAGELSFAKQRMLVNNAFANDGVLTRARTANTFRAYTGDAGGFDRYMAMYGATTPADLAGAAQRNLTPDAHMSVHIVPSTSAPKGGIALGLPEPHYQPAAPPPPARSADANSWYRPPATLPAQSFSPDTPALRTLPDGTRVAVARRDMGSVVRFRVALSWTAGPPTPEGEFLVSRLVHGLMVDGVPLQLRLSRLGAALDVGFDFDVLTMDVDVVRDALGDAVHAVLGALDAAKFSEEDFRRLKDDRLKWLSQHPPEPTQRLWQTVWRRLYVGSHRYHRDAGNAERDLKTLDRAKLERYLRAQVVRSPLAVSFVGDLDADAAESVVKAARKNGGSGPRRGLQQSAAELAPGAQLEENSAATETSVIALCPVPRYGEPDFATGQGFRFVLGGSLPSKLADRATTENAKPIRTTLDMMGRQSGVLVFMEASVPSPQAVGAVRAILDRFSALAENGPGAEDLAQARRAAMSDTISWYDSIKTHSRLVAALGPPDVDVSTPLLTYRRAQSLTAADVQALAKRCVSSLRIAALGQVKEIAAELEKRKFGPVAIHPAPETR